ncbi:MAG: Holliday junction ATP-dependent DNA helicase RuvA [Chlamydiae bacterium]|nr:Holliday junction ATP-dependent DNA helicase RuvA [Chlamydiota bacterium]
MFILISCVRPKMALPLLKHFDLTGLLSYQHKKDLKLLTKIPGVGKQTAVHIELENPDKILEFEITDMPQNILLFNDATKALVQLGYPETKAQKAVRKLLETHEHIELTQLVTQALQIIHL